jgi:hypothetical protein
MEEKHKQQAGSLCVLNAEVNRRQESSELEVKERRTGWDQGRQTMESERMLKKIIKYKFVY